MEENIAYGNVNWNQTDDNLYELPEVTTDIKETVDCATRVPPIDEPPKKKCSHFNIFISIIVVITLILSIGFTSFFLVHYSHYSQTVAHQTLAVEFLESEVQKLQQELNILSPQTTSTAENATSKTTTDPTSMAPTTELLNTIGSFENPAHSCNDISYQSSSGYYWIQNKSSVVPFQVYCETSSKNCSCNNTTGGWLRVANIDMTNASEQCPAGFSLITRTEPPLRTCGRPLSIGAGCASTMYGHEYTHVCGRITGYQVGSLDAFRDPTKTIDQSYVNGISLTHGHLSRQHIWSFAGAVAEGYSSDQNICPCTKHYRVFTGIIPSYIGTDYFCDTAIRGSTWTHGLFYPDDPLWDGQGCGRNSTCCDFNNPPWFCRQLPQATTDDIELRMCDEETSSADDSPFEAVEIFVN